MSTLIGRHLDDDLFVPYGSTERNGSSQNAAYLAEWLHLDAVKVQRTHSELYLYLRVAIRIPAC